MPASVRCRYHFAFRDYVNAEELAQMITRRGGLTWLLLRIEADSALTIAPNGQCTLVDRFRVLGGVPLRIRWDGAVSRAADRIDWTSSQLTLGWRWLRRTVERPPAAERLRQSPWRVRHARKEGPVVGMGARQVLVLENGVGRLVFEER